METPFYGDSSAALFNPRPITTIGISLGDDGLEEMLALTTYRNMVRTHN